VEDASSSKRRKKEAKKSKSTKERKGQKRKLKLQAMALALAGDMPESQRAKLQRRFTRLLEKVRVRSISCIGFEFRHTQSLRCAAGWLVKPPPRVARTRFCNAVGSHRDSTQPLHWRDDSDANTAGNSRE
jgi:hypothetical protein